MALAKNIKQTICVAFLLVVGFVIPANLDATIVRFNSNLGSFDVDMFENQTPQTVANFLVYLNSGAYTNSFIHRSVPGFIVQGGGFAFPSGAIAANSPVMSEAGISNTRGTIAMAQFGTDPNSATNQWFINLDDNNGTSPFNNLDIANGGFTVFGEVLGSGMTVIDQIAALQVVDASAISSAFNELPVLDAGGVFEQSNLVVFSSIVVVPEPSCLVLLMFSGSFLACRRRRV